MVTCRRSLAACLASQVFSVAVAVTVRYTHPETMACPPVRRGEQIMERPLYFKVIVVPYFVCFGLSLVCALYVLRIVILQTQQMQPTAAVAAVAAASSTHPQINIIPIGPKQFDQTPKRLRNRSCLRERGGRVPDVCVAKTITKPGSRLICFCHSSVQKKSDLILSYNNDITKVLHTFLWNGGMFTK